MAICMIEGRMILQWRCGGSCCSILYPIINKHEGQTQSFCAPLAKRTSTFHRRHEHGKRTGSTARQGLFILDRAPILRLFPMIQAKFSYLCRGKRHKFTRNKKKSVLIGVNPCLKLWLYLSQSAIQYSLSKI